MMTKNDVFKKIAVLIVKIVGNPRQLCQNDSFVNYTCPACMNWVN